MSQPTPSFYGLPHWTREAALEVLTFALDHETFALEAGMVREIIDMVPATPVPGADPLAPAVINFRGRIVPLADLRGSFGMEPQEATADTRIIVIELELSGDPVLIGLTADRVIEVTTLDADDAEEAPVIGIRWPRRHIRCLVRRDGDVIVLPDLATLFHSLSAAGAMAA